jgi:hypothetical protein
LGLAVASVATPAHRSFSHLTATTNSPKCEF